MIKLTGVFVLATSYSRTACRRTTIGAAAFHFRVRNGNGWCHYAIVTRAREALALLGSGGGASRRATLVGAVHRTALAIEVNRRYLKFQKNYQRISALRALIR